MKLSKHHMSCDVNYGRGELHCICPRREAKIHVAAVRGCVGTGEEVDVTTDDACSCTADEALPGVRA